MSKCRMTIVATAVALLASAGALAANAGDKADQALNAAMEKMQKAMIMTYSGDADADFVKSMIPHHQGAVDMANVELKYGQDPEMKKLAGKIVQAQKSEIAQMNAWLAAHQ